MSYFYQWTKQIVFFYIVMMAVMHLLPKKSYQKYLRFFGGLVLAILLVGPFLTVLGKEETFLDYISYERFWQEMDTASLDVAKLEQWQQETYLAEYEKAIAQDIAGMVPEEYEVESVQVTISGEIRVQTVELYLTVPWETGSRIGSFSGTDDSSSSPGLLQLKKKIVDFYELSAEQVLIYVSGS